MDAPRALLQSIASALPGTPRLEQHEQTLALIWDKDGLEAALCADAEALWVSLAGAAFVVESRQEAVALMEAIFADEIVAVAAFEKGAMVFCELARPDAVSAGFHKLDTTAKGDMPFIDEVQVRSWSGALDSGAAQ